MIAITKRKGRASREEKRFAETAVNAALDYNGFTRDVVVNILFTNDEEIHELNREFRNIDRPTDVLSFPYLEYSYQDGKPVAQIGSGDYDCDNGKILLGDMVISMETAERQANEYGHSLQREIGFLIVHSMLHLMGYDHMEESDRVLMRACEEKILEQIGLARPDAKYLLNMAKEVSKNAHGTSHKGAAVLAGGKVYCGCNIETKVVHVCAVQAAICNAITGGEKSIEAVALSCEEEESLSPCRSCCEFIAEFGNPLMIFRRDDEIIEKTLADVLASEGMMTNE